MQTLTVFSGHWDAVGVQLMLWLGFGLLHSGMASARFKGWWRGVLGALSGFERLIYNGVSAVALAGILAHAHHTLPHTPLFAPQGPWRWLVWSGWGCGALLLLWAASYYDIPRFLGLAQVRAALCGEALPPEPLVVSPFHRRVRHPLYACALVVLWCRPWDGATLLVNLCASVYFIIGMRFEERRLVALYGAAYRRYRARVPALVPWPGRRLRPGGTPQG